MTTTSKKSQNGPYSFKDPGGTDGFDDDVAVAYLAFAKGVCDSWIADADKIIKDYVHPKPLGPGLTTRKSPAFMKFHLRRINYSMNHIKLVLRNLCDSFHDINDEFKEEFRPLKNALSRLRRDNAPSALTVMLSRVAATATSYMRIVEQGVALGVEVEQYITKANLEGIDALIITDALELSIVLMTWRWPSDP